eukprot:CAMPEP_0205823960 /NCGR_PEP_ID=MMETSP0206-20130828/18752_1 /ASSEMBLY_ACC=CAM_ASM_000279 /TAXON_ID=36767 /ORGANISM="Euplotes focardii, Strain TN1" /LENGTH=409 /DNA_ID=CAMNT_0053121619 /DNA_START=34 /DNA_END=1263 /DNA_ORIENTATION=+
MEAQRSPGDIIPGVIKAWNMEKGFGFVTCEDGGPDLFIHQSAVVVEDEKRYRAVAVGTQVNITFASDPSGRDAGKNCTKRDGTPLPGFRSKQDATGVSSAAAGGAFTGEVKFFNEERGFGFVVPDDGSIDMFFNISQVEGQQPLQKETRVSYTIKEIRGKPQAVTVRPLQQAYPPPPYMPYPYPAPHGAYPPPPTYGGYPGYPPYPYPPYPGAPGGHGGHPGHGEHHEGPAGAIAGNIKFYSEVKQFGFITPTNGSEEIYFREADVPGGAMGLTEGDSVTYDIKMTGGKSRAVNVQANFRGDAGGAKRKATADPYAPDAYFKSARTAAPPPGGAQGYPQPPQGYPSYGAPANGAAPGGPSYGQAPPAPGGYGQPPQQYSQGGQPQNYGQPPQQYQQGGQQYAQGSYQQY